MSAKGQYVYVWTFQVKTGCEVQFEKIYGPQGLWVQLFRKSPGYLATELIRDTDRRGRYVTVDTWQDEASHRAFREQYDKEFKVLDQQCEQLTESEELIGHFVKVGPPSE